MGNTEQQLLDAAQPHGNAVVDFVRRYMKQLVLVEEDADDLALRFVTGNWQSYVFIKRRTLAHSLCFGVQSVIEAEAWGKEEAEAVKNATHSPTSFQLVHFRGSLNDDRLTLKGKRR